MSFDFGYALTCFLPVLSKLNVTMYMTLMSTLFALLGGIVFAAILRTRVPVLDKIVYFISSFLKAVPPLVLLFIFYYSMPTILVALGVHYNQQNPPKLAFAIIAFSITYIPYMSDMILSALGTIPKGQMEACHAVGMTTWQGMTRIVLPQVVVVAIPVFGNHFVNILKATAIAYMVTIVEMMGAAKNYAAENQMFLEAYVVAALVYWGICIFFDWLFARLEKRAGRYLAPSIVTTKKGVLELFGLKGQAA
ncbi:MAG: amino acid ABC transporter permease [Ethanoligenens sp.]